MVSGVACLMLVVKVRYPTVCTSKRNTKKKLDLVCRI